MKRKPPKKHVHRKVAHGDGCKGCGTLWMPKSDGTGWWELAPITIGTRGAK